jgi:hypothetical protein
VTPRIVLTTRAEASIAQMREALAFYYWLESDSRPETRLGPVLSHLPPAHLVLPRIVSIAEDYARTMLLEASERLIDTSHPLRLDIWLRAEERAESTWESIRSAWSDWHGVLMSEAPTHLAFTGFVEARNAIMHGLGELTRKQSRTEETLKKTISRLGHAHLKLNGRRLILPDVALNDAVTASAGLIEWLDAKTIAKGIVELS